MGDGLVVGKIVLPQSNTVAASPPLNVGLNAELIKVKEKYNELLMAVQSKFPGETRHETALRYIRNAETGSNDACEEASI